MSDPAVTKTSPQNNRKARLKAEHRCVSCGKQDERTIAGKTLCGVCAKRHSANIMRNKERHYEHTKRRFERMKAEHRCVVCGNQDARTLIGKQKCAECAEKNDIYKARTVRRKARHAYYLKKLQEYPYLVGGATNG